MESPRLNILIVGAGLTGLYLAWRLTETKEFNIQILEKSKGCGGRMATRRIGNSKYDHGAQFIKATQSSQQLINFWDQKEILLKFPTSDFAARSGKEGMTQLAKILAQNFNVAYNCKVTKLERDLKGWSIFTGEGAKISANQVVLTCPLPQSLDLLVESGIAFNPELSQITFSKAVVMLVQFDSAFEPELNYAENFDNDIFSVCSQKAKRLANLAEYTIVMQEAWSEGNFAHTDSELIDISRDLLKIKFRGLNIRNLEIKRWKYCQPKRIWREYFEMPTPALYLAGDAFGGASLNGAIKSSDNLSSHLNLVAFPKEPKL